MPVIARFYGIIIKMYFSQSEHGVPHFHAVYGEYNAGFNIATLEMMEGDLPSPANAPPGCHFAPRCAQAMAACAEYPPATHCSATHVVHCHLYGKDGSD